MKLIKRAEFTMKLNRFGGYMSYASAFMGIPTTAAAIATGRQEALPLVLMGGMLLMMGRQLLGSEAILKRYIELAKIEYQKTPPDDDKIIHERLVKTIAEEISAKKGK